MATAVNVTAHARIALRVLCVLLVLLMIFSIQAARTIPSLVRAHWLNALFAAVNRFTGGTTESDIL
jgi:hypothetical protein